MTARPLITFLDVAKNEGELKTSFFGPMIDNAAEAPGRGAMTELTLDNNVAGSVTPAAQASRQVSVDTNADAPSGELATIAQTNAEDGAWILLRNDTDGRDIVVIHGAGGSGQILLADSQDLTLDSTAKSLLLRREGTAWVEIGRFLGAGSYARKQALVETLSADKTLSADDDGKTLLLDASAADRTATLPLLADAPVGFSVTFVREDATAANVGVVDGNGAETISGRADIRLVSQGDQVRVVKGASEWIAVDLRASFESSAQAITSSSNLTVAHKLGVRPRRWGISLKCKTADQGYAVGDEITVESEQSTAAVSSRGVTLLADAINVTVIFGTDTNVFQGHNKSDQSRSQLTNANWDLFVRAGL